jgi:hypothetical protein
MIKKNRLVDASQHQMLIVPRGSGWTFQDI